MFFRSIYFILLLFSTNAVTQIYHSDQSLLKDLKALSSSKMQGRKTGSQGSKLAAQYIITRFKQLNLYPTIDNYQHKFEYKSGFFSTKQGVNIIGTLPAKNPKAPYVVFTAHYDHLGHSGSKIYYGADDNASFRKYKIPYIYYGVGTHKNYHTHKDTFENIDVKFYQAVVNKIFQTVMSLNDSQL